MWNATAAWARLQPEPASSRAAQRRGDPVLEALARPPAAPLAVAACSLSSDPAMRPTSRRRSHCGAHAQPTRSRCGCGMALSGTRSRQQEDGAW